MECVDTSLLAEFLGIDPNSSEISSSSSLSEFHAILNENPSSQDHNSGESLINDMLNTEINGVSNFDDIEYYNDMLLPNSSNDISNEGLALVDGLNTSPDEPLNPTSVLTATGRSSTPIVHVNGVNPDDSIELQQNQNPNNMTQPLYTQNQTSEINSTYLPKTDCHDNIGTVLLPSNEGKYVITSTDQVKYVITMSNNAEACQLLMPIAGTISNPETTALTPPSVDLAGPSSSSYDQEMPSPTSSDISYEVSTPLSVSSVHNGSESTSKKRKKYEEEPFLDDPIKERERLNAIKAKKHRDEKKRKLDVLEKENKKVKAEADQYKNLLTRVSKELHKEREENVKLKAKIQEYEQIFSQFRKQGQLLYQENLNMSDFVNYNG